MLLFLLIFQIQNKYDIIDNKFQIQEKYKTTKEVAHSICRQHGRSDNTFAGDASDGGNGAQEFVPR